MKEPACFAQRPVRELMHTDYLALDMDLSVREALEHIRDKSGPLRILYFYIVDPEGALVGVVPTRRMLVSALDARLADIMDTDVRYLTEKAEVMDALTDFTVHKYLALPVVDAEKKLVGIVDVSVFTENISDILERDSADEVFETIGFHLSQIRGASPFKAFRFRFPWLLATIASGLLCALMASRFENVLEASIVLSFFLTLVLGLGESVSMQSMTVTIQALRVQRPTFRWYAREFAKEAGTALLLGLASCLAVGGAVYLWKGEASTALAIGGSLVLTLTAACLAGLTIPAALHALRLDPKVAAGPLALAISDLFTIGIYFSLAAALL